MSYIRVTKEFSFEMAHVLEGYDGPCREIHGHSYRLFVTVAGTPCDDPANPKSSTSTAWSVVALLKNLASPVQFF